MKLISNNIVEDNLISTRNLLVRINVAWIKNTKELNKVLKKLYERNFTVFVDYPKGRKKPPKANIPLKEVLSTIKKYPNVSYFAISNVENPKDIESLRKKLSFNIHLVPKIETKKGIDNIKEITKYEDVELIMFDKEDLFSDVKQNNKMYLEYSKLLRKNCEKLGVRILELQGVVFTTYGEKL